MNIYYFLKAFYFPVTKCFILPNLPIFEIKQLLSDGFNMAAIGKFSDEEP